ncbi:vWA-MoxR associated conflict system protein [Streptomyces sp. NPDC003691]
MRGPTTVRHALVVAPHCISMPPLARLEQAATGLYEALTDRSLGGCAPGLPSDGGLVHGDLTSRAIIDTVQEATAHAARRGAVLVLALLGHGFIPGNATGLRLMGADSQEDIRLGSVNVPELLTDALDHPGIPGVLGIIDTCHAAGALPRAPDLMAGTRHGNSRISLLMASSLTEEAVDLAFSRALTSALRDGVTGAGPVLTPGRLRDRLRTTLPGQSVTGFDYDGTPAEPLWLARNVRHTTTGSGALIGRHAHDVLTDALGALDPPIALSGADLPFVTACRAELDTRPPGWAREQARHAVGQLDTALRTVLFIRDWLGGDVTTSTLRYALRTLFADERRPHASGIALTDVAIVDELTFNHPATEPDGTAGLARYLALLAHALGKDPGGELHRWAREVQISPTVVNDAVDRVRALTAGNRLGLVVSLHSSLVGEWPDLLDAWLLRDGSTVAREQFPNGSADREGAETALEEAAQWALDHARHLALPLKRLDVAVPGTLLLGWRPEESGTGLRIGARFDVRLHWSDRLTPDAVLRSIESTFTEKWETIDRCNTGAPVDWLAHDDVRDRQGLRGRLRNGGYTRGIGLTHHPGSDTGLLETLLAYTPVLLWPSAPDGFPKERHACLDAGWLTMPEALGRAYRERWDAPGTGGSADALRPPDADGPDALADLRAVWDDKDWLRFCWEFRSVPSARTTDEETAP